MVSIRQTKQLLTGIILSLFVISVLLKIGAGIGPAAALVDTAMSGLQMDYIGISLTTAVHWPVIVAKLLDSLILPLLAILIAMAFVSALDSFDIRERIARSKIKGMKGHVIIVPFNSYAEEIAKSLSEQGIKSVVMAKTKKGLSKAIEKGWIGVIGDIDERDSFTAAGIDTAGFVVACDYDDTRNAITAITAKAKSKSIKVISVVNDAANEDKMRSLKVDAFVTPELAAGDDIAEAIVKNAFVKAWSK